MVSSLGSGPKTFTQGRVLQVLRDATYKPKPGFEHNLPSTFACEGTDLATAPDGGMIIYEEKSRRRRAREWCENYCLQVSNPQSHFSRIDAAFADILKCCFVYTESEDVIVSRTCQFLSRLPAVPVELKYSWPVDPSSTLVEAYFFGCSAQKPCWEDLEVVNLVNTNVILLALKMTIAISTYSHLGMFTKLVDTTAELLVAVTEMSENAENEERAQSLFITKAFLWTSWQRCMMLQFSYNLEIQLTSGFTPANNKYLALQQPYNSGSSQQSVRLAMSSTDIEPTPYMCKWAFELLRSDRASVAADFRRFHERYHTLFGDRPPRCNKLQPQGVHAQCNGEGLILCQRFKGMKIKDQSAHADDCQGTCQSLFWDENSYRQVNGARAVSLALTGQKFLRYCEASERTMAISHVWSHGQGGRPEIGTTGFNSCLHRRYLSIAQSFGCDSYWMDTPCIPEDHELRAEAINNINRVFSTSKLTLICDRDLMDIDANSMSLEIQESLLATLLVCDWNVRAWTFLESIRARKNIHVLCKYEKALSLRNTLLAVHREGSIDIAILFLSSPHLIPSLRANQHSDGKYSENALSIERGFLPTEEAGCLLSHRPASRDGDEIVIWSLLRGEEVYDGISDFWNSMNGRTLHTSFLMSTSPRLRDCKGRSWAPSRPDLQTIADIKGRSIKKQYFPEAGYGCLVGLVSEEGIKATWMVCEFDAYEFTWTRVFWAWLAWLSGFQGEDDIRIFKMRKIVANYLAGDRFGAFLQPAPAMEVSKNEAQRHREETSGALVAVVSTNAPRLGWKWRGVFEWDDSDGSGLLVFNAKSVFLV